MKLVAFRIQHFRSIVDTGWQQLAHDNITSLIGQNESGKTSILEALKAFHDGHLIEDMLRSDLSMPKVSCRFRLEKGELENHLNLKRVEAQIRGLLPELKTLSLTRIWEDDMDSHMLMGEELKGHFDQVTEKIQERESKVQKNLQGLKDETRRAILERDRAADELKLTQEKISSVHHRMAELKKSKSLFSPKEKKGVARKELDVEEELLAKLNEALQTRKTKLEEKQDILDALEKKALSSRKLDEISEGIASCKKALGTAQEGLRHILQMTGLYASEKEQRAAEIKEEIHRSEIDKLKADILRLEDDQEIQMLALEYVFNGLSAKKAHEAAQKEIAERKKYYSSRALAEEAFKITPDFELFEDFSSLLPNRIDLEDVIRANKQAEGYKAAINFLTITGLEYSFFQQPSSRILKQKIEKLNGELSLNFQDFWRQNLGKNNKIKINFELSHYDHTNPEKSGKPYIEFWIKDEEERLYPKQRSRGVRWFLSFFLELKATAMDKSRHNKVLLIDEPGVSLHARAQEDVLAVFDDIRENMQIIYTTHSPHLIDVNKLYRILAVQRAIEDDLNSETLVFSARSLGSATADTLSPIYATMGARLNQQEIIKSYNNVIVKDLASYYFLKAMARLSDCKKECYFLPASGGESIHMMVNILIGWGLDYIVLNFDNSEERAVHENLRKDLFDNKIDLANEQLILLDGFPEPEDLFSTIDFKKHIVQVREGITVRNSDYLHDNNYSRAILASNFLQEVCAGKISARKLDEETRENLRFFSERLSDLLQ
ncbi:MAG: hypothetical protein CSA96_04825 [Bacteroidetes bacterium]|nr:MAG: hypothetical protein CSA96_04825 [Bacteroidota bacterium]